MAWEVRFTPRAVREFAALKNADEAAFRELVSTVEDLEDDPLGGSLELDNNRDLFRIRFDRDRYRIIFRISRAKRLVVVQWIRKRDVRTYSGLN